MAMTDFQILFRDTMYKITDDIMEINADYLEARTDEVRQKIIDGINSGELKSGDDVAKLNFQYCPAHKAGLI